MKKAWGTGISFLLAFAIQQNYFNYPRSWLCLTHGYYGQRLGQLYSTIIGYSAAHDNGFHDDGNPKFMNYGYVSRPLHECVASQNVSDQEAYRANLYAHVTNGTNLRGLDVLEVGSGLGAGAKFLSGCYSPKSYTGLDYTAGNVKLAQKAADRSGSSVLKFVQGDSMDMPFPDASFDVVVNVESSHLYTNFESFLRETKRVLRPGGIFLFTDFRYIEHMPYIHAALKQEGFGEPLYNNFINKQVSDAIDLQFKLTLRLGPHPCMQLTGPEQVFCNNMVGTPGSWLDMNLRRKQLEYFSMKLQAQ